MSTTTIRIEDNLKARVVAAAERTGKTAHAFMLDAIAQTVELSEQDDDFHQAADQRWTKILATGDTVAWDDAKTYVESRLRGETAAKPLARKLAR